MYKILMALIIASVLLAGCGGGSSSTTNDAEPLVWDQGNWSESDWE